MASDPSQKVLIIGEPYFSDVVADTFRTKRPEMELISDTLLANVKSELLASDVLVFQLSNGVEDATTALKILTHSKFENEKTFILVSSVQTWAETRPRTNIDLEVEATNADDDDDGAGGEDEDTFTEDMYNMRVPHVKYSAWKEVEKLVKQANGPLLHTYVLFAGLLYGEGEDKLHPVFKQAWHRAPEGLPIFGSGKNPVPMIHIRDLSTFVFKFATRDRKDDDAGPDDQRYFFATDQGNCSWHQIIKAINDTMGIGKTYRVLERDFVLYENIEHFIIGLRVEAQGITTIMEDEEEWVAQAGFVENIQKVVQEYKVGRKVLPLRICVNGPPASGKTYYSRKLLDHFNLPHFTIKDVIQQYEQQEVDLREELQRRKRARREAARRAKQEEKRAEGEGGEGDDDDDDDGNDDRDDQLDDDLDPDAMDPDADDDEEEEDSCRLFLPDGMQFSSPYPMFPCIEPPVIANNPYGEEIPPLLLEKLKEGTNKQHNLNMSSNPHSQPHLTSANMDLSATKAVTQTILVNLNCTVIRIEPTQTEADLVGKTILPKLQSNATSLIVLNATANTQQDLLANSTFREIHLSEYNSPKRLTLESAYQLNIAKSFFNTAPRTTVSVTGRGGRKDSKMAYNVSYIEGKVQFPSQQQDQQTTTGLGTPTLTDTSQDHGHATILVGSLPRSRIAKLLSDNSWETMWLKNTLVCKQSIFVQVNAQQVKLCGVLGEDFYKLRRALVSQFDTI
eukprot:TRINITY_DN48919_c0_g1_i1.p1 TRINITY_DN48919_c0_g1~~TRINITY_DN48919_c0_g1_i1.p1  ORF type:complete len:734 (+),score=119.94 TRINITY_DN48919_c0_g1_i1:58-2259(+)